jgi:hypothetical protein
VSDTNAAGSGTSGVVAGWYTDPYNPSQLRWWDGTQWTDHVAPAVAPAAAQTTEIAASDTPAAQNTDVSSNDSIADSGSASSAVADSPSTEDDAASTYTVDSSDQNPLPSRRALREAAAEAAAAAPIAAATDTPATTESSPSANPFEISPESARTEAAQAQDSYAQATPVESFTPAERPVEATPAEAQFTAHELPAESEPQQPAAEEATPEPDIPALFAAPVITEAVAEGATPTVEAQPSSPFTVDAAEVQAEVPPVAAFPSPVAAADTTTAQANQPWNPPPASQPAWEQPAAAAALGTEALFGAPASPASPAPTAVADAVESPSATPETAPWTLRPSATDGESAALVGSSTVWAWLSGVLPLITAVGVGYEMSAGGASFSNLLLLLVIVGCYLLGIVFAVADRSRLTVLGLTPTNWTFAALTAPVFLIVRALRLRGEASGAWIPAIVCLACLVIGVAGLLTFGIFTGTALAPGLPS